MKKLMTLAADTMPLLWLPSFFTVMVLNISNVVFFKAA